MADSIHFEADNTVVAQNDQRRTNFCVSMAAMRLLRQALRTFLFEFEAGYSFEAILGNRLSLDQHGPVLTCRVLCDTTCLKSSIPIGILREMVWSYAGPNPMPNPDVTSYLANAFLTPITLGLDAWTAKNKIEVKDAVVPYDPNINVITLGWRDLYRLGFRIWPVDENGVIRFGFEIEEVEDDEGQVEGEQLPDTDTEDSSDEDD